MEWNAGPVVDGGQWDAGLAVFEVANDTVAPSFTGGLQASNVTIDGFNVLSTVDEEATVYVLVVPPGTPQPTPAEIIAGVDYGGVQVIAAANQLQPGAVASAVAVATPSEQRGQTVLVYAVPQDAAGNVSASAIRSLSISIPDVNAPPTGSNFPQQQVTVGQFVDIDTAANFQDTDPLTYTEDGRPPGTQFTESTGRLYGNVTEVGSFVADVTATDTAGNSVTIQVPFLVTAVPNDPPQVVGAFPQLSALEGQPFTYYAAGAGVFSDTDQLAYSSDDLPADGFSLTSDGYITGTPETAAVGLQQYAITATDTAGQTATATLAIEVAPATPVEAKLSATVLTRVTALPEAMPVRWRIPLEPGADNQETFTVTNPNGSPYSLAEVSKVEVCVCYERASIRSGPQVLSSESTPDAVEYSGNEIRVRFGHLNPYPGVYPVEIRIFNAENPAGVVVTGPGRPTEVMAEVWR